MSASKDKPRLSLCVRFEEDFTYHASIRTNVTVEYWRESSSGQSDWSGIGSIAETSISGYEDLVLTCYTFDDSDPANGFQASYEYRQKYSTSLHDAELMVKTLKAIYKASDKLTANEGYPRTFGQAVNRMARIVGASIVRIEKTKKAYDMTYERYSECAIGDAVSWLDSRIGTWLQERKEAKQMVSA